MIKQSIFDALFFLCLPIFTMTQFKAFEPLYTLKGGK